jgi:hypothetical protein
LKSLPSHDSVIRLNCAISKYKGQGEVFYVHPDDIDEYNLPEYPKTPKPLKNEIKIIIKYFKFKK